MISPKRSALTFLILAASAANVLLPGCDDQDVALKPDVPAIEDFEGTWIFTHYELAKKNDPGTSLSLIDMGGSITFEADEEGLFMGNARIPEELGGEPIYREFEGRLALVDRDTLSVVFNQGFPIFLEDFSGAFTLDADTLTVDNDDTSYDFDFEGNEEPAALEAVLVRTNEPLDPSRNSPGGSPRE